MFLATAHTKGPLLPEECSIFMTWILMSDSPSNQIENRECWTAFLYLFCLLDNKQVAARVQFTWHTRQTSPPPTKKVTKKQIFFIFQMIESDGFLDTDGFIATSVPGVFGLWVRVKGLDGIARVGCLGMDDMPMKVLTKEYKDIHVCVHACVQQYLVATVTKTQPHCVSA